MDNLELIPLADNTGTTISAAGVDCLGALDIMVVFPLGDDTTITATHFFTFSFTECATLSGSYTAVPDAQFTVLDSWDKIWNDAGEANAMHVGQVELSPGMRYLKAVATDGGTSTGVFGVYALITKRTQPASS